MEKESFTPKPNLTQTTIYKRFGNMDLLKEKLLVILRKHVLYFRKEKAFLVQSTKQSEIIPIILFN